MKIVKELEILKQKKQYDIEEGPVNINQLK